MKILSIKRIAYILIINFITILIITNLEISQRNKLVKFKIFFEVSDELRYLNDKIGSHSSIVKTQFSSLPEKIINIFKKRISNNDKFKIISFEAAKPDLYNNLLQKNLNTYIQSTVKLNSKYDENVLYIDLDKTLSEIKLLYDNELDEAESKIRRNADNLKEITLFYKNKLNEISLDNITKDFITQVVSSNRMVILKNPYLYELISQNRSINNKDFDNFFNLKIETILLEDHNLELFEKIFAYFILVNSIIYIFLRYYKFKN
tara:strand:+ start:387 stop:1172 length:786 start_codon:yes stop_codon:yes gene_type:complete